MEAAKGKSREEGFFPAFCIGVSIPVWDRALLQWTDREKAPCVGAPFLRAQEGQCGRKRVVAGLDAVWLLKLLIFGLPEIRCGKSVVVHEAPGHGVIAQLVEHDAADEGISSRLGFSGPGGHIDNV